MMAGSGEGADVQAELHALRRRLNGLSAQQNAALAVTAFALCASVLLAVALRAAPIWFTVATWSAGALLLGLLTYLGWRAYRTWLSLDEAAHLADRSSGLEGRLSTLLADPAPASRLRPILVEQVRIARPRWQTETLAPRRFAPTLLLVPASLMVLAIVAFLSRPAAPPTSALQPWQTRAAKLGGAEADARIAMADTGATELGAGKATGGTTGSAQPGGRGQGQGDEQGSTGKLSAARDGSSGAAGDAGDASGSDRLREAIRDAMGAERDSDSTQAGRGEYGKADGDESAPDSAGDRPDANGVTSDSRSSDAEQTDTAADGQSKPDPNQAAKGDAHGGNGGTKGAGAGGATGTLFAEATQGAAGGDAEAKPMPIKLGAFAAAAPQHGEPQRRDAPVGHAVMTSAGRGPAPDLAVAQAPDAALQKIDLAPEHESIVRRIFTRE
jgi:hypothetical protein